MGLFDKFRKRNSSLISITEDQKNKMQTLMQEYNQFYQLHSKDKISLYGLLAPGEKTPFHDVPTDKSLSYEFPFDDVCIYEYISNKTKQQALINKTAYGNIPVASEGCGIYWVLIVTGKHAGEVWLLTEFGITPVGENMTLDKWWNHVTAKGTPFWYPVVSSWGHEKNDFFYAHAPVKYVVRAAEAGEEQIIFGNSSPLCQSCIDFMGKFADDQDKVIVVTDCFATFIFGALPPDGEKEQWTLHTLPNGLEYYRKASER